MFYTSILSLFFIFISLKVIFARRKNAIAYGPGKNNEIAGLVSSHSNFASYVPMIILLMFFVESYSDVSLKVIHFMGICTIIGRVLHFYSLSKAEHQRPPKFRYRRWGMYLTMTVIFTGSFLGIYYYFIHIPT